MAGDDGVVYLFGYSGAKVVAGNNLKDTSTTFGADPSFIVKVVFLDPPSDDKNPNNEDEPFSLITLDSDDLGRTKSAIDATIQFQDANGNAVRGFVNLAVEGGASVVFTDSSLKTHRVELEANGMKTVEIKGLPKTGPFKIKLDR